MRDDEHFKVFELAFWSMFRCLRSQYTQHSKCIKVYIRVHAVAGTIPNDDVHDDDDDDDGIKRIGLFFSVVRLQNGFIAFSALLLQRLYSIACTYISLYVHVHAMFLIPIATSIFLPEFFWRPCCM